MQRYSEATGHLADCLVGRQEYIQLRKLQNHVLCDSWRALCRRELSDLESQPDAASFLHKGD